MSRIKSIKRKKIINETLHNLAVKEDESYIANNVVVHNCRSLLVYITSNEDYKTRYTDTWNGQKIDKPAKGFGVHFADQIMNYYKFIQNNIDKDLTIIMEGYYGTHE